MQQCPGRRQPRFFIEYHARIYLTMLLLCFSGGSERPAALGEEHTAPTPASFEDHTPPTQK